MRALALLLPLIVLGACSDEPEAPVAPDFGADAGISDVSAPDFGPRPDGGAPPDAGDGGRPADGGAPVEAGVDGGSDAGVGSGEGLRVFPEPLTFPAGRGSVSTVSIRNEGPGGARISAVIVRTAADDADSPDFVIEGCGGPRCTEALVLCDPAAPSCSSPAVTYDVRYRNPDASPTDDAILRVEVPGRRPIDVVVFATDAPCPFPTPRIDITPRPEDLEVGDAVVLDGRGSDPGGEIGLVYFFWSLTDSPGPVTPALSGQGGPVATFTSTAAGRHELSLSVTNGCGQTSASPARVAFVIN